jgi:hypothetical protein
MAEETNKDAVKNEDIPFRNKAIETIKQLSQQNNVLKSRLKSRNNQQTSVPQISGLRGLETRLGQQFIQ